MSYNFTIRDTECNSKVFGDCEICNKNAVQIFHQKRFELIKHPITNLPYEKFISDCYGHYSCLMEIRQKNLT